MQQLNALKTLKDPSHGRTSRRSVELIGNGLLRFGQTCAQPMFGQTIDRAQQSTMITPSATMRSGFLRNTEEARNKGYAQEAKATFDAALAFIGAHHFFLGEHALVQDIGSHDETGGCHRTSCSTCGCMMVTVAWICHCLAGVASLRGRPRPL